MELLLPPSTNKDSYSATRHVKLVSEPTRERECFKYNPSLATDYRVNDSGRPLPSSELVTSKDSILAALAQLGTYQTGTDRGLISLFDESYQYIIAEATPSTPLTPRLSSDDCPTPLVYCGTAIPRSQSTCEHVLYTTTTGPDTQLGFGARTGAAELPLSVIPDLAADDRVLPELYCEPGTSAQFYAGVPIRTSRGINIGTYCVTSSNKSNAWDEKCTRSLREISRAIMHHLENNRSQLGHRRNERMSRGLGSFIEGKSTLSGWLHGPNAAAFEDHLASEGALNTVQQRLERRDEESKDDELEQRGVATASPTIVPLSASRTTTRNDASHASIFDESHLFQPGFHEERIETMGVDERGRSAAFSRAANIIREAFEVEGCVFFDVTVGSYRTPNIQSSLSDSDGERATGQQSGTSSSEDYLPTPPAETQDAACDLLGFSTSRGSSINATQPALNEALIGKRFLATLLRHYPEGKIFNFDAIGELQSSDSSEDDVISVASSTDASVTPKPWDEVETTTTKCKRKRVDRRYRHTQDGTLIHQAFPSARSVAFVPVWDSKRERWFAGGFMYTLRPTRIFTIEGELSLLKAFSKLVTAEVHNLQTLQANKAKSDALGSLSHELRSPLHGIILSTELLNDTDLTVFQGNATHTIETCCRTLLDTLDHLLDYTKINSFAAKNRQPASVPPRKLRKKAKPDQFDKKRVHCNTRLDRLVEEVVESVFAGYNFQNMSIRQVSKQHCPNVHVDRAGHNWMDTAQAMEQLGPITNSQAGDGREHELRFGNVSVFVLIDPTCDWMFQLPSGAVRRIVMNLFGNALKFTTTGSIWISLGYDKPTAKRSKEERRVKLTVQDTGKGISVDYIQHRLFKPFTQEDELASGTGLGLSLVKKIVSTLHGQIFVESQVGVGTKFTVILPLEPSPKSAGRSRDDEIFEAQVKDLRGLRVRLAGFGCKDSSSRNRLAIVEKICRETLRLEVIDDESIGQLAPDVVLWLEESLPTSFDEIQRHVKTPNVVICHDAVMAYLRLVTYEAAGQSGVFDFVSQPIGPRKLAKSIQLAYKRWMGLPNIPSTSLVRPSEPHTPQSSCGSPVAAETGLAGLIFESQNSMLPQQTPLPPNVAKQSPVAKKILLVDDNHINLKILSAYMGKLSRPYEGAVNGKEALDAYVHNHDQFAGILMDISMPIMDGLEATRRIRNFEHQHRLQPVAIIALTGLASGSTHQEALESGVNIFLTKPVRLKALSEILESMQVFPTAHANGT